MTVACATESGRGIFSMDLSKYGYGFGPKFCGTQGKACSAILAGVFIFWVITCLNLYINETIFR